MQTLKFSLFSFITLTIISNAQTVIPPGDVSGTWAIGGSPYEINGEITIPNDSTLTIEPGVLVEFQGHYKLNVQGRLLAVGTETDTITFTINDTTGFSDPDTSLGGWNGIKFDSTSAANDSSKIINCRLQYGKVIDSWPDNCGGAIYVADFDKLLIAKCLITNNSATGGGGGGIFLGWSSPRIEETTISYNIALWGGGILCFFNSSPIIRDNNIIGNYAFGYGGGIECTHTSSMVIENNIIIENDAHEAAGIRLEDCSLITITDNVITSNTAIDDDGGGIYLRDCNDITIERNTISNNSAEEGGGIWQDLSETTIANNTISDNTASIDGGGIFCKRSSDLTLIANTITGNQADYSGGGLYAYNSNLQIDSCSFGENEVTDGSGGAIYFTADTLYNGMPFQLALKSSQFHNNVASSQGAGVRISNYYVDTLAINVTIDDCDFIENSANGYAGVSIHRSSFNVSNSIFKGNTAIQYAAGAGFSLYSVGTVWNCLFVSNVANTGGGSWNSGGVSVWSWSNVDFMNCTFADNSASYGAGLTLARGSVVTTTNCIFWGNTSDQIALDTYDNEGGILFVNHCDVQGGEDSVNVIDPLLSTLNWGIGNADDDPLFANASNGDYHLQDNSNCINAGIDEIEIGGVLYYSPPDDIEGNPRPNPPGTMPDMGAYESPFPVGVEDNETGHPTEYALYQNYPNPFNPSTKIKYSVPQSSNVVIKVFDILGNEIETLVNEEKQTGTYEITWYAESAAGGLPSGVYFYKLQAGSFIGMKKMIFLK